MSVGSYFKPSAGGGMISIQSSATDFQAFQDFAAVVPKAAAAAHRRAINKTLGWLRTHIARAVSRSERIAVAAVRQRLRSYPVSGGAASGKLWFGLNAIESSRIGRARQTGSGVSVAGRRYQGAFLKKVYGNKPDIWIRTASKHFNGDDYPDSTVSPVAGRVLAGSPNTAVVSHWLRPKCRWSKPGRISTVGSKRQMNVCWKS